MVRIIHACIIAILFFFSTTAHSQDSMTRPKQAADSTVVDARQLVDMPPKIQLVIREDMRQHLAAFNEVIAQLAAGNLDKAAEVAETKLGRSSMGKHRAKGMGMGPGRFMPPEMRAIGRGMHQAASQFAEVAQKGDLAQSVAALQKVSGSCVACHYSFRIR